MPKQAAIAPPSPPLGRPKRMSRAMQDAIRLMVWEGKSRKEAASLSGVNEHSLYCALCKPHVVKWQNEQVLALRRGEVGRAYGRIARMAEDAASEHVKLSANQWIAGVDGLAPVSKVDVNARVQHSFVDYDYADAIDVTPDPPPIDANDA